MNTRPSFALRIQYGMFFLEQRTPGNEYPLLLYSGADLGECLKQASYANNGQPLMIPLIEGTPS